MSSCQLATRKPLSWGFLTIRLQKLFYDLRGSIPEVNGEMYRIISTSVFKETKGKLLVFFYFGWNDDCASVVWSSQKTIYAILAKVLAKTTTSLYNWILITGTTFGINIYTSSWRKIAIVVITVDCYCVCPS